MILLSHCESYPGLDRRGRRDGRPGDEDRHGGDEQQDDGAHASIDVIVGRQNSERKDERRVIITQCAEVRLIVGLLQRISSVVQLDL